MNVRTFQLALLEAAAYYEDGERSSVSSMRGFCLGKALTCRDISAKIARFGSFASDRQKEFASKLVLWATPLPAIELTAEELAQETPTATGRDRRRQWFSQQLPGYAAYIAQRGDTHQPRAVAQPEAQPSPIVGRPVVSGTISVVHQLPADEPVIGSTALSRIQQLFASAREHGLRRPRINVRIENRNYRLYPGVRNPQATNVREISPSHGGSTYVGFITSSGSFVGRDTTPAGTVERLMRFGLDPEGIARAHGLATGNCCFCGRGLTDQRSVAMGYGPICADHYGLEWGARRARPVEITGALVDERAVQPLLGNRIDSAELVAVTRAAPSARHGTRQVYTHDAVQITVSGTVYNAPVGMDSEALDRWLLEMGFEESTPQFRNALRDTYNNLNSLHLSPSPQRPIIPNTFHPDIEEGNAFGAQEQQQEAEAAMAGMGLDDEDRVFMVRAPR